MKSPCAFSSKVFHCVLNGHFALYVVFCFTKKYEKVDRILRSHATLSIGLIPKFVAKEIVEVSSAAFTICKAVGTRKCLLMSSISAQIMLALRLQRLPYSGLIVGF